jgi:hypothetical protein
MLDGSASATPEALAAQRAATWCCCATSLLDGGEAVDELLAGTTESPLKG